MREVERSRTEPKRFARDLFDELPDRYDRLAEVLSFGQNRRWRQAMVDAVCRPGASLGRVLDVASGTAGVALLLARRTNAAVTAVDLTDTMLAEGRRRVHASVEQQGLSPGRIQFVVGDADRLPFPDASFDALTFTYLLRYVAEPAATLRELARVLRPGGRIASLEFAVPASAPARYGWRLYTRAVLPAAGYALGGPAWWSVGRFLGPSIDAHYASYPVHDTVTAWEKAGFEAVVTKAMSLGGGLVMSGRRRTPA